MDPSTRTELMNELRESISKGDYHVNSSSVALRRRQSVLAPRARGHQRVSPGTGRNAKRDHLSRLGGCRWRGAARETPMDGRDATQRVRWDSLR